MSGFVHIPSQHSIVQTSEIYFSPEWPLQIVTRWIVAGTRRREKNPKVAVFGTSSNGSLAARSGRISRRGDRILPVPLFTHRRIGFSIFTVRSSLYAQWEENPKRHHYYPWGGRRAMITCQCSPTTGTVLSVTIMQRLNTFKKSTSTKKDSLPRRRKSWSTSLFARSPKKRRLFHRHHQWRQRRCPPPHARLPITSTVHSTRLKVHRPMGPKETMMMMIILPLFGANTHLHHRCQRFPKQRGRKINLD